MLLSMVSATSTNSLPMTSMNNTTSGGVFAEVLSMSLLNIDMTIAQVPENGGADMLTELLAVLKFMGEHNMDDLQLLETTTEEKDLLALLPKQYQNSDVVLDALKAMQSDDSLRQMVEFLMLTSGNSTDDIKKLLLVDRTTILSSVDTNSRQTNLFSELKNILQNSAGTDADKVRVSNEVLRVVQEGSSKLRELVDALRALVIKTERTTDLLTSPTTFNNQSTVQIASLMGNWQMRHNLQNANKNETGQQVMTEQKVASTESNSTNLLTNQQSNTAQNKSLFGDNLARETIVTGNSVNTVEAKAVTNQEPRLTYTNSSDFNKQVEDLMLQQARHVKKPNGQQTMTISLQPAHLGSIKLIVTAQNGVVSASISSDTAFTRELLETSIGSLRGALVGAGINVDRIEVQQTNTSQFQVQNNAAAQSQLQQQKKNQQEYDDSQNKKRKESDSFSMEELEELAKDFIAENQLDMGFVQDNMYTARVNYTV